MNKLKRLVIHPLWNGEYRFDHFVSILKLFASFQASSVFFFFLVFSFLLMNVQFFFYMLPDMFRNSMKPI